jgi:transposase-like protein
LLAERGVTVDHVTIYRWVQRFTPEFIEADRAPAYPCVLDELVPLGAAHRRAVRE